MDDYSRKIFLEKIPLRDYLLLHFFEWGEIRTYCHNQRKGINRELSRMKKEGLVEIGKNDYGKPSPILRYPDGFNAMDRVLKKWPIYSIDFAVQRVRLTTNLAMLRKHGK